MPGTAFITGISGQDGTYLAEFLLEQGYAVHGMLHSKSSRGLGPLARYQDRIGLYEGDLADQAAITALIGRIQPTEIYNLAAQTFVPLSWQQPVATSEVTALGVTRLLESIRAVNPAIRFFQAGSSEMFGSVRESPQNENTPFRPRSPYGVAKVYAHQMTVAYREAYGIFACSGILYNHESPRRGPDFVTGKIVHAAARIKRGLDRELRLGNLEAQRDWGFAGDYVRAMWLMLQQAKPDDYVLGSGELHKVEDFVRIAFEHVGLDWRKYVVVDPKFYRPVEAEVLLADPSRAEQRLGWRRQVTFEEVVRAMVDGSLRSLESLSAAPTGEAA